MSDTKSTKLNIREDRPTALSSPANGANLVGVGFNLLFVATYDPKLAADILKLYAKAHAIQEGTPKAPDEDYELFAGEVTKLLSADPDDL